MAGGIVLTSVGGLTFLLVLVAVIGNVATGHYEDTPGYLIVGIGVTVFGGVQVWAGILAALRRRSGKVLGLVVSWVGVALAVAGAIEAFVAEDALGDLPLAAIVLLSSVAVIILLTRGEPR